MQQDSFVFPASFAQQRLWFLEQLEPGTGAYNVPATARLAGPLHAAALERSLNEIVRRHEALRTTFATADGQPVQVVAPELALSVPVVDLRGLPQAEREAEARRLATEEIRRPFDLARGPLLRAALLRLDEEDHVLALTLHHIISDGWSMNILYRELSALYEAFVAGRPSALPDLPVQYADFAVWQRQWLQGEVLEEQLAYWKQQLAGLAVLELPTDRPRGPTQSVQGAREFLTFPGPLAEAVRALGRREGATLFMTLLAALKILLHRYTGQDDIAVGAPIAGRTRLEVEGLIGFFVNTLVLRTDLGGNPTVRELVARVRETALRAYAFQELPFEKLVEELRPERDRSRTPLFQVMLAVQNASEAGLKLAGLTARRFRVESGTEKFDWTLALTEGREGISGWLGYNTALFEAPAIARAVGHYRTLIEGMVADPDRPIAALPLLTEPERRQVLIDWNATAADVPRDKAIPELFEAQAERTPDHIALVLGDQSLTYRELNVRANRLAHRLRALGVGHETPVAICAERSFEMIVGLLGILKAGGAYVPLDPGYPRERLALMLEDTRAPVLLTQEKWVGRLPESGARVLWLDAAVGGASLPRDDQAIAREPEANPEPVAGPDSLAYVMYTSGSTGTPKGVEIPHRGIVRLLFGVDYVRLDASRAILHLAPFCFDASTFEVWGALLHGGRCVLFPDRVPTPRTLGAAIRKHGITTLFLTTALFNLVIDEEPGAFSGVEELLTGGEAMSIPHIRRALEVLPSTRFSNIYGPTETTTFATSHPIARPLDEALRAIPIGRPISNTEVFLLDRHLNPVPLGVPGELCIGGPGLARGYLGAPELTAAKFVPHPFSGERGARLYRTGDLARYLPDGNIEFLGRLDHQVKLRGFRIELGEIEAKLREHPGVRAVVVVAREDRPGDKALAAYVVAEPGVLPEADAAELRGLLERKLPDYMVPSAFVFLESLPLTATGKADRGALPPVPDRGPGPDEAGYVAPRDLLERGLAEIWQQVMGLPRVGVRDNFFEVGGHSLLAVQLLTRIERVFGRSFPLATLFQAPTIERLAAALRDRGWSADLPLLVPLETSGSGLPLFCLSPMDPFSFVLLARHLPRDRPVYALQPRGIIGVERPHIDIHALAAQFLEEVRAVQPHGPYLLCGICAGGIFAYEMAQRLHEQGEEVGLLAMIDTAVPVHRRLNTLDIIAGHAWHHLRKLWGMERGTRLSYAWAKLRTFYRWLLFGLRPMPALPKDADIVQVYWWPINWAYRQAMRRYTPKPYPGHLALIVAADTPRALFRDSRLMWRDLAGGGVDLHTVAGKHENVLREPGAGDIAEILRGYLRREQAD